MSVLPWARSSVAPVVSQISAVSAMDAAVSESVPWFTEMRPSVLLEAVSASVPRPVFTRMPFDTVPASAASVAAPETLLRATSTVRGRKFKLRGF